MINRQAHPTDAPAVFCIQELTWKMVDEMLRFCYNIKAKHGVVLKWSKRRDSKSEWAFWHKLSIFNEKASDLDVLAGFLACLNDAFSNNIRTVTLPSFKAICKLHFVNSP